MSRFGVPGDPFREFDRQYESERMVRGIGRFRRNQRVLANWYALPPWWRWTVWLAIAIDKDAASVAARGGQ